MENLKEKTFDAVIWKFAGDIGAQLASFALGIVLARIISPAEYGLLSMVLVISALSSSIIDGGMSIALIREKNATKEYYNTVFVFNTAIALLLSLIVFFIAPYIADFYNQIRLTNILRVMSIGFVINAFGLVPGVILSKELHFKKMAIISLPSVIVSGTIGIILALNGFGVWALVIQSISAVFIRTAFISFVSKFIPQPQCFSLAIFKKLFSFSYKLSLSGILNSLFSNIYPIIIGKLYAPSDLGYYTRADSYKNLATSNITNTLMAVVSPVLAKIQDDTEKLKEVFRKMTKLTVMVNTFVMVMLMLLAKPIIIVTITHKWLPTVPLLQILCVAALLYPLHVINLNLLLIKGKSGAFFRLEIFKKILTITVVFLTYKFGLLYFVMGAVATSLIGYFINIYYTKLLINYSFIEQILDVYKFFVFSMLAFILAFYLDFLPVNVYLLMFLQSSVFILFYMFLCYYFEQKIFFELKDMILTKFVAKNK